MMRRPALVLVFLPLIFSREALASLPFPLVIQEQLSLKAAPACTLCHLADPGELGTVVRPFGQTAKDKYGLTLVNTGKLRTVIAEMEANGDDSDGDGDGDIAELRAGTDPNVPHGGQADDAPRYGCYCAAVPRQKGCIGAGSAWLAGFFLVGLRISSRRSRRATHGAEGNRFTGRRGRTCSRIATTL
jgi:hypothetical protein